MENLEAKFAGLLQLGAAQTARTDFDQRKLLRSGAGDRCIALQHLSAQSLAALARPRGVMFARWRRGFSTARAGGSAIRRGLWSNWTKRSASRNAPSPPGNCRRARKLRARRCWFSIKPKKNSVPSSRARFRRAAGVGRPTPRCLCWRSGSCFCGSISTAAMNRRAMAGRRRWRRRLREYSRELQEKAKNEGLRESAQYGPGA